MGKKTLEEIGKILLVSIISILISVMATRRVILDKKLDRSEYIEDQSQRWGLHKEIHDKDDKRMDEVRDMVKFLYENELKKQNK